MTEDEMMQLAAKKMEEKFKAEAESKTVCHCYLKLFYHLHDNFLKFFKLLHF